MIFDKTAIRPERSERHPTLRWAVLLLAVALLLLQGGCAVRQQKPDEIEGVRPQQGRPRTESAAAALLSGARHYEQTGRFDLAGMTLERALRLEPRNAALWQEMARVKFGLKDYGQAVQFCLKSNSLAGKESALVRKNWELLAQAYEKTGERDKAAQAQLKAKAAD